MVVNGFALFDAGSIIEAEFFDDFDPSADCTTTFGVCDTFDILHVTGGFIETGGLAGIAGLTFQLPVLPPGFTWPGWPPPSRRSRMRSRSRCSLAWLELDLNNQHHDLLFELEGSVSSSPTPEPGAGVLVACGLAVLWLMRRRLGRSDSPACPASVPALESPLDGTR